MLTMQHARPWSSRQPFCGHVQCSAVLDLPLLLQTWQHVQEVALVPDNRLFKQAHLHGQRIIPSLVRVCLCTAAGMPLPAGTS